MSLVLTSLVLTSLTPRPATLAHQLAHHPHISRTSVAHQLQLHITCTSASHITCTSTLHITRTSNLHIKSALKR